MRRACRCGHLVSSAARSASVNDPQLVAGRNIFHRKDEDGDEWEAERVATDWPDERVHVVAEDVDGDVELLLTECEIPSLGTPHDIYYLGRFTICSRPDWESEVLRATCTVLTRSRSQTSTATVTRTYT